MPRRATPAAAKVDLAWTIETFSSRVSCAMSFSILAYTMVSASTRGAGGWELHPVDKISNTPADARSRAGEIGKKPGPTFVFIGF